MRKSITMVILVGLLCSFSAERSHAAHKAILSKFSWIPYNAEIGGIRAGYNTVGQLEHRLWPGATFNRDRPDRVSVWQVKSTGWIIEANDGDYEDQGRPLYGYTIETSNYRDTTPTKGRVCYVALPPRLLKFNKRISLGMNRRKVMTILHAMHIRAKGVNDLEWSCEGSWAAIFEFRKDMLVAMGINYS